MNARRRIGFLMLLGILAALSLAPGSALAGSAQAHSTFVPLGDWRLFSVERRFFYSNPGPDVLPRLDLYVALPQRRDHQRVTRIYFSAPYEQLSDQYGQPVAHFEWTDLQPNQTVEVNWLFRGWLLPIDYGVDPEQVEELDQIPDDIVRDYTTNEQKYRLESPIIQDAAQTAADGATNPYWIARNVWAFVMRHVGYVSDDRWDDAETVYLRGTGSCSEQTFLVVALCRANGLPARYVGGPEGGSPDSGSHRWAEVYLPPYGWVPVDSTQGRFGAVTSAYMVTAIGGGDSEYLEWEYRRMAWLNRSGVYLAPPYETGLAEAAETKRYTLSLTNLTGAADEFALTVSDSGWPTRLSMGRSGRLAHGASVQLNAYVDVPATAAPGDEYTFTVHAASVADPSRYTDTSTLTARAYIAPQIAVSPDAIALSLYAGQSVTQPLAIQNGEGMTLTYTLVDPLMGEAELLYPLNEAAGRTTFRDLSGNGHHASCVGAACPTAGVDGRRFRALEFDGLDDRVVTPLRLDQTSGSPGATLVAWVYPTSTSPGQHHVISSDDGGFDWSILRSGASWHVFTGEGNRSTSLPVDVDQWQHLAAVFEPGRGVFFYKNGQPAEIPYVGYDQSSNSFVLGDNAGPWAEHFDGRIDEVQIYASPLSAQEVWAIYATGTPYYEHEPWLSTGPISGEVAGDGSVTLQVALDAGSLPPADYTSWIVVHSNDPDTPLVSVPVTMTVHDPSEVGRAQGTVTDADTGVPLAATVSVVGGSETTDTDPSSGAYELWLEAGSYTLQASATGHVTQTVEVQIVAGQTTTQDFGLEPVDTTYLYLPLVVR